MTKSNFSVNNNKNNKRSYSFKDFLSFLKKILSKEKKLYWLVLIYGIGISILGLAMPISVQYIISNITFTALLKPLIIVAAILFFILVSYVILKALQIYAIHIFSKHFFTRIVGDIFNSFVFSNYELFERRNRTDIANRFFEIINIQKVFPDILFGGISIVQQVFVGFLLISFYHPYFFIFSCIIILAVYLTFRAWGLNSLKNLHKNSYNKYEVINILENISNIHKEFKSKHSIEYAKNKVDNSVADFLINRNKYFKSLFSQSVTLLIIYIFASIGFLMIGSILVLNGEITIGQLVAMELVVSTMLLRLSEFGKYLDSFYELAVSCAKLNIFYDIEQEKQISGKIIASNIDRTEDIICMKEVEINYQNQIFKLDFSLKDASSNLIAVDSNNSREIFCKLLYKLIEPNAGEIQYYGQNIENVDSYSLRNRIFMIDTSDIYESTIREYLTEGVEASQSQIQKVLHIVQLDEILKILKIDLDHKIVPGGYPFSITQTIRLKVAKALLYQPDIIILGTIFDRIEYSRKQRILKTIKESYPNTTLIHFTNINVRDYDFKYDQYLFMGMSSIKSFEKLEDLSEFEYKFFIKKLK